MGRGEGSRAVRPRVGIYMCLTATFNLFCFPSAFALNSHKGHSTDATVRQGLQLLVYSTGHVFHTSWFKHITPNVVSHECRMQ